MELITHGTVETENTYMKQSLFNRSANNNTGQGQVNWMGKEDIPGIALFSMTVLLWCFLNCIRHNNNITEIHMKYTDQFMPSQAFQKFKETATITKVREQVFNGRFTSLENKHKPVCSLGRQWYSR